MIFMKYLWIAFIYPLPIILSPGLVEKSFSIIISRLSFTVFYMHFHCGTKIELWIHNGGKRIFVASIFVTLVTVRKCDNVTALKCLSSLQMFTFFYNAFLFWQYSHAGKRKLCCIFSHHCLPPPPIFQLVRFHQAAKSLLTVCCVF